jgi:serine/threonine protein kinase
MESAVAIAPRESSTSRDAALAELVEGYLARLQSGEAVSPSEFAAQHPEHAERLVRLLPALELMDDLRRSSINLRSSLSLTPVLMETPGVVPGLLGDFQILREVGRGGMGVVYEARQLSLNRRVALKVLPLAAAMDSRQLQRFQVEAQAAACLHHTNIVPIHAVGCERGVHYYAMQFIEGQTLASFIGELRMLEGLDEPRGAAARETSPTVTGRLVNGELAPADLLPSPLAGEGGPQGRMRGMSGHAAVSPSSSIRSRAFSRTVASLGIQAAEALEHAHGLGVFHRDIKPANLLVDDRGTLWITDFGLARLQNDSGLTMTGDLMGTLRYMSPEQALAKHGYLDHRTDIYSLGASLYELLTLRPAFPGDDRQAVLRKIAEEEPTAPPRLNESIPRELETIVLKAMAKEPESRYATARELADDLRRFLEHKPTKARRPSLTERVTKWSRRHTDAVIATTVVLVFAVVGLAISTVLIGTKQLEIARQRDEAQRHGQRARHIVDEMYTRLSERWLALDPGDADLRREFLEKAAAYYEEFAQATPRDAGTRLETAYSWLRAGEIEWQLRRTQEGESAYLRAIALFGDLADESKGELLEAGDGRIRALIRMGDLLAIASRDANAEAFFRNAL